MSQRLQISLLHGAPRYDDIPHNFQMLDAMVGRALEQQPDVIVMPELAVSGYEFYREQGIDWVARVVPDLTDRFRTLAQAHETCIILCTPSYAPDEGKYFNSALFIDETGAILGEHRKIAVLPGSEGWSSPGKQIAPIVWKNHKIGLLICADAYTADIANTLAGQGAEVLISPAAWAPGLHEPDGEWEQRSRETGLTLLVCNRTGIEKNLAFSGSSSVVVAGGKRLMDYKRPEPAILTVNVDATTWRPLDDAFDIVPFSEWT